MRTLILSLTVTMLCLGCSAQSSKPSLTAEQKVALYQSRDKVNAALEKLKATSEYQDYMKAQNEQATAIQSALKGIDTKKWALGNDLEFTTVPEPKPAEAKK